MGNLNKTTWVVFVVGGLSILFAVIALFNGRSLSSQLWGLFLGIILIGTAWIESQKKESN